MGNTAERCYGNSRTQLAHDKNPDDTAGFRKPAALRRISGWEQERTTAGALGPAGSA
jgi:hypothetical protein